MARSKSQTGNGDQCPVDPSHGQMLVLQSGTQYCADQSHDGRFKRHPLGKADPTPNRWPGGHLSFAAAVKLYHEETTKAASEPSALPELDITLEV